MLNDPRMAIGASPNQLVGQAVQGPQMQAPAGPFSAPQAQPPQAPKALQEHAMFIKKLFDAASHLPTVDLSEPIVSKEEVKRKK